MKRIIFIIILIASFFIIKNFVFSIYTLWQKQGLVERSQMELNKEKKENQTLKEKLNKANSQAFIEEQARNRLFLVKSDEQRVFISQELIASQTAKNKVINETPNWKKWWKLFF